MLSNTDQEIALHLIDALNARVGLICGQRAVLQPPAPTPCPGEWGGGRGCILITALRYACDGNAGPCSWVMPS